MRKYRVSMVVALVVAAPLLWAADSEMMSPLPTLNTWSAGKTSLSVFGGLGKTNVGFSIDGATPSPDGQHYDLDRAIGRADYDDKDWSAGLRYAFPMGENLTLELGGTYFKGKTELEHPFVHWFADPGGNFHEQSVAVDSASTKDYALSFSGFYTLPSGAESPVKGGVFVQIQAGKRETTQDIVMADQLPDVQPVVGYDIDGSFDMFDATRYVARLGISADIHVVRDIVRITPMIAYYYRYDSIRSAGAIPIAFDEALGAEALTMSFSDENDRYGGMAYGIELGYRPGGTDGKFEVVLTPYFKTERRQLVGYYTPPFSPGYEVPVGETRHLQDHRNGVTLMLRTFF